ncbi:hypothetical protein EV379_0288 [Microterricola gilva]|uniref:Uncharacterized protein n=1 Tax=Microterricola gilva TaxID=393267 RepID=A0A4Q8AJN3_9MICO|nr:hypothetical protein EV379_0288 [Microterricola gilva]
MFSLQFVLDYVQLRVEGESDDEPFLNCDVWPDVTFDGESYWEPDLGYRGCDG